MPDVSSFLQGGALGVLTLVLVGLAYFGWHLYTDVVKPMATRHMEFTHAIEQSNREMLEANKSQDASTKQLALSNQRQETTTREMAEANQKQVALLQQLRDNQERACRYNNGVVIPAINQR